MGHLWLREECKKHERRTALIPEHAKHLIKNGHQVTVETSNQRIFDTQAYQDAGCKIALPGSWKNAPLDAYILGLKNLPEENYPLKHKHIYFAHSFKKQRHSKHLLSRFKQGGGLLYDLEYLTNESGRRVAAFGFYAGLAGAAISLIIWCLKQQAKNPPYKIAETYLSEKKLAQDLIMKLTRVTKFPTVLIIGSAGRCGQGAHHLLNILGVKSTAWGREETRRHDFRQEILKHDILLNCIYVDESTPIFLTREDFNCARNLTLITDISCEPSNRCNPLPFYQESSTFKDPTQRVSNNRNPVDLVAIDNLPSFLPVESSMHFSSQLIKHLLALLDNSDVNSVWSKAEHMFLDIIDH
jgi:saccharopine dehydrogenase (NAD+, L-lysine-forming)